MNVLFDNVDWNSSTGPNAFAKRLAHQFSLMGHHIADATDYDVMLAFIEPTREPKRGAKLVQRLDGIWFKPDEYQEKNKGLKRCYDLADGIIWQSEFDSKMTTKWFGAPKSGIVINNGVSVRDLDHYFSTHTDISWLHQMVQRYERIFVSSANWHPQKRLSMNVAAFKQLQKTYPESCLIVMGNDPDMIADQRVFYTGNVGPDVYVPVYRHASWMIHLAWLDHCPNTVIEALSQGTNIICASSGGTREIIGDNGIIVNETTDYDFELVDYDSPPDIDVSQLGKLPIRSAVDTSKIDIANVAKRYVEYIETLL